MFKRIFYINVKDSLWSLCECFVDFMNSLWTLLTIKTFFGLLSGKKYYHKEFIRDRIKWSISILYDYFHEKSVNKVVLKSSLKILFDYWDISQKVMNYFYIFFIRFCCLKRHLESQMFLNQFTAQNFEQIILHKVRAISC